MISVLASTNRCKGESHLYGIWLRSATRRPTGILTAGSCRGQRGCRGVAPSPAF